MQKFLNSYKKGFSLLEVLIFVTIISFIFIASASYITSLLRTMKINEHRAIGTQYADEVLEWLRSEREEDWNAFSEKASTGAGTTYCFNSDISLLTTIVNMKSTANPNGTILNTTCTTYTGITGKAPMIYKREVTLKKDAEPATRIEANIKVSWMEDGNVVQQIPVTATFSIWE
jgi:Tfp pilus assembly protein PilV